MILYLDTSALVKKYIEEPGSEKLFDLLQGAIGVISSLVTPLELTSFAERSRRDGRIDSPTHRKISSAIEKDLFDGGIGLVSIELETVRLAIRLMKQRRLRTLDSLHLSSALLARKAGGRELRFVCADRGLLEAAALEGLKCCDVKVS